MNRRMTVALVTLVTLIIGIAWAPPAQARSQRTITGNVEFPISAWEPGLRIWFHFDVQEVRPADHQATGYVSWTIYSPSLGWRYVSGTPTCAAFDKDRGDQSTAVIVVELRSKRGWGAGQPGEFARFWVRDGGQPGHQGDQWGLQSYDEANFIEFWPATEEPNCTSKFYFDWPTPVDIEGGNLTIH